MIVGVVLDHEGRPLCCELWPGNVADVTTLVPVDRLRQRFHISSVCIVADRGMISRQSMNALQAADDRTHDILGARLRSTKEVDQEVLSRPGRSLVRRGPRQKAADPSLLQVKEVFVENRRSIVCPNVEQARQDKADRDAIVASLREQLKKGDKTLVGNGGYRRFLSGRGAGFEIDEAKIRREERYDGKWVIQTDLSAEESRSSTRNSGWSRTCTGQASRCSRRGLSSTSAMRRSAGMSSAAFSRSCCAPNCCGGSKIGESGSSGPG